MGSIHKQHKFYYIIIFRCRSCSQDSIFPCNQQHFLTYTFCNIQKQIQLTFDTIQKNTILQYNQMQQYVSYKHSFKYGLGKQKAKQIKLNLSSKSVTVSYNHSKAEFTLSGNKADVEPKLIQLKNIQTERVDRLISNGHWSNLPANCSSEACEQFQGKINERNRNTILESIFFPKPFFKPGYARHYDPYQESYNPMYCDSDCGYCGHCRFG